MCMHLFLAAEKPLPLVACNKQKPGLHLSECEEKVASGLREIFFGQYLYDVGSHAGCACPFGFEPDWENPKPSDLGQWQENREDFRQLIEYLHRALQMVGTIEIYAGEEFWFPPLVHRSITIDEISADRFIFNEREYLMLRSS